MDRQMRKEITDRIKFLRNKQGYTQEQMAEKVGLEYGSYVQMENGANLPSINVFIKLSRIFSVSIDSIVFGNNLKEKLDIDDAARLTTFLKLLDLEKLDSTRNTLNDLYNIVNDYEQKNKM